LSAFATFRIRLYIITKSKD